MITNDEFIKKLYKAKEKELDRKYSCTNEMNYSKGRLDKLNAIGVIEKQKVGIIVPLENDIGFYRSKYLNINKSGLTTIRCRNIKEYYCINDIKIQELQEQEYKQMLEYYNYHKERTTKSWSIFIRRYPIVDDILLDKMIIETSSTKQQVYKKRIQWERYREMNNIDRRYLFKELEKISEIERKRVKEMKEYNDYIKK